MKRIFAAALVAALAAGGAGTGHALEIQKQPQEAAPKPETTGAAQFDLGQGYKLGVGGKGVENFATDISELNTYSLKASLSKSDFAVPGDRLGLQVSKPLRIYPGTVPAGIDEDRQYLLEKRIPDPAATGSETDLTLSYLRPIDEKTTGGFSLSARQDVDNIEGENDVRVMFGIKRRF